MCIEKNPSCKAVEWWENGPNDCYDCINPSLRIEYNDDTDESYPPHVLVRPIKAAGKLNVCLVPFLNLSLPRVPKVKIQEKSQIQFIL